MNITSLLQNSSLFGTSSVSGSTKMQNTQSSQGLEELLKKLGEKGDSVTLSEESRTFSRMPPEKPDFANMSDEDLTSFLTEMQERGGSVPGVEDGTSVSELTSEQLQEIRDKLTEMSAKMEERMSKMQGMGKPPHGMGGMQGPPPMDIQNMSDDDLKTLLEQIRSDTGSIPGIDSSEETDVSSLSAEQLQSARDALTEMMQKRMEEMSQSRAMFNAAAAYEANNAVSL